MWETSRFKGNKNQRGGSQGDGGKGGKGGGRPKAKLTMKRIQAQLVATNGWGVPATVVQTRLILNDLGPNSCTLFATQSLELGQEVTLTIEHPRQLLVRGKVTYNALFDLTPKIHCEARYSYRVQIEFDFLNDGEAQAVREYVEEINSPDLRRAA